MLQSDIRAHFGIPEPAAEHRADADVGVLVQIVRELLQLGVHSSLEEAVEASLRENFAFAQRISAAVKTDSGVRCLRILPCARQHLTLQAISEAKRTCLDRQGMKLVCVDTSHSRHACLQGGSANGSLLSCTQCSQCKCGCSAGPSKKEKVAQKARKAAEEGIIGEEDPLLAVSALHLLFESAAAPQHRVCAAPVILPPGAGA